jgi:hypothetical protein
MKNCANWNYKIGKIHYEVKINQNIMKNFTKRKKDILCECIKLKKKKKKETT